MKNDDLISRYNYDSFVPSKFGPWLRFDDSPKIEQEGPDFPLWSHPGGSETRLSELMKGSKYTVVEFGSFT